MTLPYSVYICDDHDSALMARFYVLSHALSFASHLRVIMRRERCDIVVRDAADAELKRLHAIGE